MKIVLDLVGVELSGLRAIDERRRLGLPEGDHIVFCSRNSRQAHASLAEAPVDEAFARVWFTDCQTESHANVTPDLLVAKDVRPVDCNNYAVTFADLSRERIEQLYVAVRFRGVQAEVDRLKAQLTEQMIESENEDSAE